MKYRIVDPKCAGLTVIEVIVIVATLVIAAAVLVPAFGPERSSRRMRCVSNLKDVGTAFINWSHDREMGLPWTVPLSQGGTLEQSNELSRNFQVISNELGSAKLLVCPQDGGRKSASEFDRLANANLSYFLGLDADRPNTILSGDRTLTTNHAILSGTVNLQYAKSLYWANGIHAESGNICWNDGSVDEVDQFALRKAIQDRGSLPARLLLP
jgi:hypothetical protein